ncbi:MAG: lipopolysaccharide biosynthesis protein [Elusimicrobiaceae bacterium]|nr:lipopolysaccharide biosynthesis protein [Elusimicrobiaceae bacterium]
MEITPHKKQVLNAFSWKFAERMGLQGVNFVILLVLARLLTPADYGVVALVMIFVAIANTLVQAGFNTALIQKKDPQSTDFFSVLMFSLMAAFFFYMIIYLVAPWLAKYYKMPALSKVMRVTALMLFPMAFQSIQIAYLTHYLKFKILTIGSCVAIILAGIAGITSALCGMGIWALVIQQITNHTCACICLLLLSRWFPIGKFSFIRLKKMFGFGSRILFSNLLVTLFMNLRSLFIGRLYSAADLGFFNRGKQFPQALMDGINGTIQSVLLPVYAKHQDNKDKVIGMLRQTIRISVFLIFPLMCGLAAIATPLVQVVLSGKWILCVSFIQIFAFSYMCQPSQIASTQTYTALGDSSTPLKLEFVRKGLEMSFLLLSLPFGVKMIALSSLVAGIGACLATFYPNHKLLKYSFIAQLQDIVPALLLSCTMAGIVWLIGDLLHSLLIKLIVQISVGMVVYLILARIFRMQAYNFLWELISNLVSSKRGKYE